MAARSVQSLKVLVVHNSPKVPRPLRELLSSLFPSAADIESAVSADAACELLEREEFDLVLVAGGGAERENAGVLAQINKKHATVPAVLIAGDYSRLANVLRELSVRSSEIPTKGNLEDMLQDVPEGMLLVDEKRVYDVLDDKQKNLEAIFKAAPVAMMLIDENLIVRHVNDSGREIVRKDESHTINKRLSTVVGCLGGSARNAPGSDLPDGACEIENIVKTVINSKKPKYGIEVHITSGADDRGGGPWLRISAEPTLIDGAIHVVLAMDDITDHIKADRKMQETMEMKSRFISTVSHELRTPLASLKNAITVILEGATGRISDQQKGFLDIAERNVERLTHLINDVLDVQKLDAGKTEFDMQPNDITELVTGVQKIMTPFAVGAGVRLSVEFAPGLPEGRFDRDRITQVLTNLVDNAIKCTPEGGKVCVAVKSQADRLVISVSDTGVGIPADSIGRIFDRFYSVPRAGQQAEGTGLGLAIVKRIVTMHDGEIGVESQVNKGTTFIVSLPLNVKSQDDA